MGLLKAAPPSEVSALHKQRVWLRLTYSPGRRVAPLWRRAVLATGVLCGLLGLTAVASAGARGHWPDWAVRVYQRLLPDSDSAPSALPRVTMGARGGVSRGTPPPTVDRTGVVPATGNESLPVAVDTGTPSNPVNETNHHRASSGVSGLTSAAARRANVPLPRVAARAAIGTADESRPVLAAMRALRRDHDPVRARTLLHKYLGEHPDGTLAEEAMAITIEAALVHHDADADALGRRYLDRYPHGPFRALAEHARAVSSAR